MPGPARVDAIHDSALGAMVFQRTPLALSATPQGALVRSSSALAWVGRRLAVYQDDANFVALVDVNTGHTDVVAFPHVPDAAGGPRSPLDLEACAMIPSPDGGVLVAFDSGATLAHQRVVVARGLGSPSPELTVVDAGALYSRLRETVEFAGAGLNIEGAAVVGDVLRLFQRGNAAPSGVLEPVDATCDLACRELLAFLADPRGTTPPPPERIVTYDLGEVDGMALTFTDAAARGTTVFYLAEASPGGAIRDARVAGVAVGVIDRLDGARWTGLRDTTGAPFTASAEGLAVDPNNPRRAYMVLDSYDPEAPAELCTVELTGPW